MSNAHFSLPVNRVFVKCEHLASNTPKLNYFSYSKQIYNVGCVQFYRKFQLVVAFTILFGKFFFLIHFFFYSIMHQREYKPQHSSHCSPDLFFSSLSFHVRGVCALFSSVDSHQQIGVFFFSIRITHQMECEDSILSRFLCL